jgi:mRNA-degrading endonuclease HigB of HigAB toxin-antitoxin module
MNNKLTDELNLEEDEYNIRLPDEVKRETLIEDIDIRSSFEKQIDEALFKSIQEYHEHEQKIKEYETRIINESFQETEDRKQQFASLLHDVNKVSKFDTQIKEIYTIIEPIIESYCAQFITNYEFDEITYEKIFTTLSTIRTNKNNIELLKTIIIKS